MTTYREAAESATRKSGALLIELSKSDVAYKMKSSHDILADADLRSEEIIIETIKAAFPGHDILSEEAGQQSKGSKYLWAIDPIDGTINFARHNEEYCISIALSEDDQLILGVIYQPALNKLYVAEKGQGAYLNGKKIMVSKESELINCLAAVDNSSKMDLRIKTFDAVRRVVTQVRQLRVMGSSALHLARMAEGQLDFYFKFSFNFWDYAAGMLILEEAGGKVTGIEGGPLTRSSKNILASNGLVHDKAQSVVSS